MEWTKDVTLEFLKLYEQEPAIWNPKDPQHKSRTVVNDAWQRIENAISIECSIKDLKKKKESLMASFRSLLNKYRASRLLGDEDYTPNWFAFETMANFLQSVYQPRTTINTQELEDVWRADDSEVDEHEDSINIKVEDNSDDTYVYIPKNTSIPLLETESRKRKNNTETVDYSIEDGSKRTKSECEASKKDECSLYAELLAIRLRAFDENTRDIVMHEIDSIVFKAKMQQRNSKQHSQQLPSASFLNHH